jgi:hypothetical protein
MRMFRRPMLLAAMILLANVPVNPASATTYGNCYWNGTNPICRGSCRAGFYVRGFQGCSIAGYKVKCCEPMGTTSQSQSRPRHCVGWSCS